MKVRIADLWYEDVDEKIAGGPLELAYRDWLAGRKDFARIRMEYAHLRAWDLGLRGTTAKIAAFIARKNGIQIAEKMQDIDPLLLRSAIAWRVEKDNWPLAMSIRSGWDPTRGQPMKVALRNGVLRVLDGHNRLSVLSALGHEAAEVENATEWMVSVLCLTYNHLHLIRQALDGILMQETDFSVEVLVHDDASTDGTSWIMQEYADRYPYVVRAFFQRENQLKKTGIYPIAQLYGEARGRYWALCDGDDYWTDPLKLSKQVAFMEENQEFSICHHDYMIFENGSMRRPARSRPVDYSKKELIGMQLDGYGIGSCTKLWRNYYNPETRRDWEDFAGDYPMNVLLGTYGPCKYIPGIQPSVYRRNHGSNSWCSLPGPVKIRRTAEVMRNCYNLIREHGNPEYVRLREAFL